MTNNYELTTFSKVDIDLSKSPTPEQIRIEDIAHSLSQQCRYAGHTPKFYSVAEHCVHITKCAPKLFQMYYLLHDAHEYLYQDITRPLKNVLEDKHIEYRNLCDLCDVSIMEAFNLSYDKFNNLKKAIKKSDILLTEIERNVMFYGYDTNSLEVDNPFHNQKFGLEPQKAEKLFLETFYKLVE